MELVLKLERDKSHKHKCGLSLSLKINRLIQEGI
jgi:hypothetical protein